MENNTHSEIVDGPIDAASEVDDGTAAEYIMHIATSEKVFRKQLESISTWTLRALIEHR